ncbi:hypothetical protein PMAG_a2483 [Pseudoalteromonas mariniglutinosa NCIMB 1770]|nr:hypothetical protein [Pseudoalteromonas mariniglutinosa NCIMB 1770]
MNSLQINFIKGSALYSLFGNLLTIVSLGILLAYLIVEAFILANCGGKLPLLI